MVRTVERGVRFLLRSRLALWIAFVLVHLTLGAINLYSNSNPMGDVRFVYKNWVDEGFGLNYWVGIDVPWVYPIVAMLPMIAAGAFGLALYPSTWLSLVMVLDAVALASLTGWGMRSRNLVAGWWWVLFIGLLGPIALGRIDAPSIAIAMLGVLVIRTFPMLAGVLVALATWIKVWPAALIAAMVIAVKQRVTVLVAVLVTSAAIIAIALAFGAGANVFSFVTQQTGRGLQVEAPVSTIWLWRIIFGDGQTIVDYSREILTFQVSGPGVDVASMLMTPIMAVAIVVVALLGIRATRRGMDSASLLPVLSLGFVVALIAFNKVLSPQYIGWLAVPVVLALVSGRDARAWMRTPIVMVLAIAALTQIIYPYLYDWLLVVNPLMVIVLTVRNLLLVVLWVVSVERLWAMGHRDAVEPALHLDESDMTDASRGSAVASPWPLGHHQPAQHPEEIS